MTATSVIVCCYNDGRYLARALTSLCHQTLPAEQFEVILVNDGSSDETGRVALSFSDKLNLKYLKHDVNKGLAASCNAGIEHATGDYVIRLDADDSVEPCTLQEMTEAIRAHVTDLVFADRFEDDEATGETRYVNLSTFNVFKLIACGTMLKARKLREIGGYRGIFWEEYDLYMRYLNASDKTPFYISRAFYHYTIRAGSMTADPKRIKAGWEELKTFWSDSELARFGLRPFANEQ